MKTTHFQYLQNMKPSQFSCTEGVVGELVVGNSGGGVDGSAGWGTGGTGGPGGGGCEGTAGGNE